MEIEEETKHEVAETSGSILSAEEIQCWSSVKQDPTDFQSWIKLLQFAEQKSQVASAREAFEQFLQHYPYCYGYWRKFADYERKHSGIEEAKKVLERGLSAIPLSVDLWIHYLNFIIQYNKGNWDQSIRNAFEDAIDKCGLEARSGRLWEAFIDWEKSHGNLDYVLGIYDRLLVIPVIPCEVHFEKFQQFVNSNDPEHMLKSSELLELKQGIDDTLQLDHAEVPEEDPDTGPPGMESGSEWEEEADVAPPGTGEEDRAFSRVKTSTPATPVIMKLRERIVESRRNVFNITLAEVEKRKHFETAIKRPYFHAKPLDKVQLQNWRDYLDFEISQGDKKRIIFLFERCVIACALYEEFWLKFLDYIEPVDTKYAGTVYDRACTTHCPKSAALTSRYTLHAAKTDDTAMARSVLEKIEAKMPGAVITRIHRIVLERQHGCYDRVEELFRDAIDNADDQETRTFYLKRYSTFAAKFLKDLCKGRAVIKEAIDQDMDNESLYLQWLDLELSDCLGNREGILTCFDYIQKSALSSEQKALFRQRHLQYLQEFGESLSSVLEAYDEYVESLGISSPGSQARKRMVTDGNMSHAKKTKSETEEPVSMNNGSDAEGVMVVPSESTAETPSSGASVTTPAPSTTQSPQVQVDPNAWAAATYEQQYQQQYQQYQQQWAAYYSQQQAYGQYSPYSQQTQYYGT